MRLNDALIEKERYRGEPTTDEEGRTQWPVCVVWDDEVTGFGVRIYPPVRGRPSRKDFIVNWRTGLKSRTMAIGTYGVDCTLRQARRAAREALDLARRGQDPIEARQRALGIGTNEDLASRFLYEHTAAAKKKGVPGGDSPGTPGGADAPEGGEAGDVSPVATLATPGSEVAVVDPGAPPDAPAGEPAPASGAPPDAAVSAVAPPDSSAQAMAAPDAASPAQPEAGAGAEIGDQALFTAAPPPAAPALDVAAPAVAAPAPPPQVTSPQTTVPDMTVEPPPPPPAPPLKRGPTKVRLVPVPEALHREIERRARASSMTLAVYLQGLLDHETSMPTAAPSAPAPSAPAPPAPAPPAPAPPAPAPPVRTDAGAPHRASRPPESAVMPKDLFARIQASQTVDMSALSGDMFADDDPGSDRD